MSDNDGRFEDRNEVVSIATIHRAQERGVTLMDTAKANDADGSLANAKRVAEASFKGLRDLLRSEIRLCQ